jgi:hypothetical protein
MEILDACNYLLICYQSTKTAVTLLAVVAQVMIVV